MKGVHCPICEKKMDRQGPKEWPDWPFCSPRCRMVDLGRWLGGVYRIETPAGPTDEDESDPPAGPSADVHKDEA
jgi:endogenous inhibitor of DNA gyrase (YacG/DUF329 family)